MTNTTRFNIHESTQGSIPFLDTPICPSLDHDPYIQVEQVKGGSDPNNTDVSEGAVVRVSCSHGYVVNLSNDTIICEKGKWRPKVPQCSACNEKNM